MSRRNTRRSQSTGKPAWVWFVLGNFVGGFAVFIFLLNDLKTAQPQVAARADKPPAEKNAPTDSKPKFDFYKLLEENEVKVPAPKNQQVRVRESDSEKNTDSSATARSEPESDLVYILQAASFRDREEAERLRAQLMLANLDVKVESATDSRGTWHRVLVGPYTNRSKVAKARSILAEHRLMPLVLKRPAQG
ncbi:SPOR domain-containing protein [Microbulbifer bruguierae]|uniref:SPOR domain-containing protein n=1 Tax=Microbulbifer bruguierae TaxID=3029061 RepID=A0ABY8NCM9_9GAMM|nr:SPOR domain-containing protein [Microbulbifer bruguierae]WGL15512.1 SPOR domain-containing protein [Microbulbifer bruguierae]